MTTTRKASAKTLEDLISAVFRVTDKTSAFLGYGVPSKTEAHKVYHVTWNEAATRWECDCDGNAKWHRRCDHIKVVNAICKARRELGKTQPCPCEDKEVAVAVPAKVEEVAAIFVGDAHVAAALHIPAVSPSSETRRLQEAKRREEAVLNPGRAFSILRV